MKGGLHQTALAFVKLALAGKKTVAEQDASALQHPAFLELGLVGDQDVANGIGMSDVKDAGGFLRNSVSTPTSGRPFGPGGF
jgi:hypothetical protein